MTLNCHLFVYKTSAKVKLLFQQITSKQNFKVVQPNTKLYKFAYIILQNCCTIEQKFTVSSEQLQVSG